jgi:hypothetical protein
MSSRPSISISNAEYHETIQTIGHLKVSQLKDLARSLGLMVGGLKKELHGRIIEFIKTRRAAYDNVALATIRILVLKLFQNGPIPEFGILCSALASGAYKYNAVSSTVPNQLLPTSARRQMPDSSVPSAKVKPSGLQDLVAYKGHALYFKESPFFRLKSLVHGLPQAAWPSEGRGVCTHRFVLSDDDARLLASLDQMQVYLLCGVANTRAASTSSAYIQFPHPIEFHVNGTLFTESVKGIKNKIGTARPAKITKHIKPPPHRNHIEMVYLNTKETYLLYCYIVETVTCEEILQNVLHNAHIPVDATRNQIAREYNGMDDGDDDIIVETLSVSLRCPLTYARMKYPCKSIFCEHIQCFDALSFIQLQEQLPSWQCPICSKLVQVKDLAISDYYSEVLRMTSDDIESVALQADGSWKEIVANESKDTPMETRPGPKSTSLENRIEGSPDIEIISLGSESEAEEEHAPSSLTPVVDSLMTASSNKTTEVMPSPLLTDPGPLQRNPSELQSEPQAQPTEVHHQPVSTTPDLHSMQQSTNAQMAHSSAHGALEGTTPSTDMVETDLHRKRHIDSPLECPIVTHPVQLPSITTLQNASLELQAKKKRDNATSTSTEVAPASPSQHQITNFDDTYGLQARQEVQNLERARRQLDSEEQRQAERQARARAESLQTSTNTPGMRPLPLPHVSSGSILTQWNHNQSCLNHVRSLQAQQRQFQKLAALHGNTSFYNEMSNRVRSEIEHIQAQNPQVFERHPSAFSSETTTSLPQGSPREHSTLMDQLAHSSMASRSLDSRLPNPEMENSFLALLAFGPHQGRSDPSQRTEFPSVASRPVLPSHSRVNSRLSGSMSGGEPRASFQTEGSPNAPNIAINQPTMDLRGDDYRFALLPPVVNVGHLNALGSMRMQNGLCKPTRINSSLVTNEQESSYDDDVPLARFQAKPTRNTPRSPISEATYPMTNVATMAPTLSDATKHASLTLTHDTNAITGGFPSRTLDVSPDHNAALQHALPLASTIPVALAGSRQPHDQSNNRAAAPARLPTPPPPPGPPPKRDALSVSREVLHDTMRRATSEPTSHESRMEMHREQQRQQLVAKKQQADNHQKHQDHLHALMQNLIQAQRSAVAPKSGGGSAHSAQSQGLFITDSTESAPNSANTVQDNSAAQPANPVMGVLGIAMNPAYLQNPLLDDSAATKTTTSPLNGKLNNMSLASDVGQPRLWNRRLNSVPSVQRPTEPATSARVQPELE